MSDDVRRELMRLLHGELSAGQAEQLQSRMDRSPALKAEWERLQPLWQALELPAVEPAPSAFAHQVRLRMNEQPSDYSWGWTPMPVWARAVAVLALAAGLGTGAFVAELGSGPVWFEMPGEETLADSYERALGQVAGGPDEEGGR